MVDLFYNVWMGYHLIWLTFGLGETERVGPIANQPPGVNVYGSES